MNPRHARGHTQDYRQVTKSGRWALLSGSPVGMSGMLSASNRGFYCLITSLVLYEV